MSVLSHFRFVVPRYRVLPLMALLLGLFGVLAGTLAGSGDSLSDSWQAVRVRGHVFTLVDGGWVPLTRGDVVPDARVIRSGADGRARLQRGAETIDLGGNTQIAIHDRPGKRFTTVNQDFGEVLVDAEHRNVQHFAVQTKFVAAVVKGTRFIVRANGKGAWVTVKRGAVEVRDKVHKKLTLVRKGQSAEAGAGEDLNVSGSGELPDVVSFVGSPNAETVSISAGSTGAANSGNANAGPGNNNAGGNGNGNANGKNKT